MFQEFPKCMTDGDKSLVVFNQDEEKAARADGYVFHSDKPAVDAYKLDRKPRAQ